MSVAVHPVAIEHLPPFVSAPGESDILFLATAIFLIAAVLGIGVFYFKLHSLPERIAHRGERVQMQIVAVLGLVSLFTHNHAFWIAGLLLAIVPLPDFSSPLGSIAGSLERLASAHPGPAPAAEPAQPSAPSMAGHEPGAADHREPPAGRQNEKED